eukprot:CAMPEP_0185595654 /NCGR_PEP_ID=MMETSP0434-20130131/79156_1 /TAXON_ID=626734 ORGANISM="Favella taraikaensis, Strain Fe Narragansett Bay" /NCGR_SAMPLE_ID=MMETSP0434 /ASSEMBLY_ACC=CAM_ASM_000379 /LENGTH=94 /DNA_ID=CAMNT_0028223819 /DNA_START=516 /DNA_END=797 /DNA_ORIENTATION=-
MPFTVQSLGAANGGNERVGKSVRQDVGRAQVSATARADLSALISDRCWARSRCLEPLVQAWSTADMLALRAAEWLRCELETHNACEMLLEILIW